MVRIMEIYEEMLTDIRKYIRDNNLDENDFIYIRKLNNIIIEYSFTKKNDLFIKEKIGDVILKMEDN